MAIRNPELIAKRRSETITLRSVLLRLFALMLFWVGGAWLMLNMWLDGYWPFALTVLVVTLIITIVWLRPQSYPLRWMSPGLAMMVLVSVYPIVYTFYISFTNFGTGHLLPKVQVVETLESRRYLPENGREFTMALYRSSDDAYALALSADTESVVVVPGATVAPSSVAESLEGTEFPDQLTIDGTPYSRVPRNQMLATISSVRDIVFGADELAVQVTGTSAAAAMAQQFVYDEALDAIADRRSGVTYFADDETGQFVARDGTILNPGYSVGIGFDNYTRFLNNPSFRGPLAAIFIWTVLYALVATLVAFSLGLFIAIAFGRNMPASGLIKTLLIIPFAIPEVITILIWRGMLNPINGIYGTSMGAIFGQTVNVFSDPTLVKIALITVQVWLSYPYFYLISSGALQAIAPDMYEAAEIDGGNWWQQFRFITLPLLLISVGPLLIGSFMYTFNSFNLIFLFNSGGPPMVGTSTPAGHSDILISYVYRLAFESGGQDYGYATAITVIIFAILLGVTLIQYRYMNVIEKVGENV